MNPQPILTDTPSSKVYQEKKFTCAFNDFAPSHLMAWPNQDALWACWYESNIITQYSLSLDPQRYISFSSILRPVANRLCLQPHTGHVIVNLCYPRVLRILSDHHDHQWAPLYDFNMDGKNGARSGLCCSERGDITYFKDKTKFFDPAGRLLLEKNFIDFTAYFLLAHQCYQSGQFSPSSSVSSSLLIVNDHNSQMILVDTSSRNNPQKIGTFIGPEYSTDIITDLKGYVYVAGKNVYGYGGIMVYEPRKNFALVQEIGNSGPRVKTFDRINCLCIDRQNNLYVCDPFLNRTVIYQ